jgi:hypothetical protein
MNASAKRRFQQIFVVISSVLSVIGCQHVEIDSSGPTIKASGPEEKQTRSLNDFDRVEAGGVFQVDVTIGPHPSVAFEAPKQLLPHLTAKINGGTLELACDTNYDLPDSAKIKAHVVATKLAGASISGAGSMVIVGKLTASSFEASTSGTASMSFSGNIDSLQVDGSGASKTALSSLVAKQVKISVSGTSECMVNGSADSAAIEASGASSVIGQFSATSATANVSGTSHASLHVTKSLTGEASGASEIAYSGQPPEIKVDTSGVSQVVHQ